MLSIGRSAFGMSYAPGCHDQRHNRGRPVDLDAIQLADEFLKGAVMLLASACDFGEMSEFYFVAEGIGHFTHDDDGGFRA